MVVYQQQQQPAGNGAPFNDNNNNNFNPYAPQPYQQQPQGYAPAYGQQAPPTTQPYYAGYNGQPPQAGYYYHHQPLPQQQYYPPQPYPSQQTLNPQPTTSPYYPPQQMPPIYAGGVGTPAQNFLDIVAQPMPQPSQQQQQQGASAPALGLYPEVSLSPPPVLPLPGGPVMSPYAQQPPPPQPQPQPQQTMVDQYRSAPALAPVPGMLGAPAFKPLNIHLRSSFNYYIAALNDQQNAMALAKHPINNTEILTLICLGGHQYAIRTCYGKYLCAENNGKVVANRTEIGPWETWTAESSSGYVSFKSHWGKYLMANHGGYLFANSNNIGSTERFSLVLPPGQRLAFRTYHNTYVCAERNNYALVANREVPMEWEYFTVAEGKDHKTAFRSHHGRYICAEKGNTPMNANREKAKGCESFRIELHGNGQIALLSKHNKYVCAEKNFTMVCNRDKVMEWERFLVE